MAIVNNETQGLGELFIRELDNNTIEKVIDKNGIALETMTHTLFPAKCSKWTVWIFASNFFFKKKYGWGEGENACKCVAHFCTILCFI